MSLINNDIENILEFQQFHIEKIEKEENRLAVTVKSSQETDKARCPYCGGSNMEIHNNYTTRLKDIPLEPGGRTELMVWFHRYKCRECGKTYSEDIPMKCENTRITNRAANWIKGLLRSGMSIMGVHWITGISWDTIKRVHREVMEEALEERAKEQKALKYKPTFLAVDEFSLHKGHKYATCVLDLVTGDVIWVGTGRSMASFESFFEDTDPEYLSDVKAIAMDMNASYYRVIERRMPEVTIVYDRYHMQAQFGRDVLGSVRLASAKEHQETARLLQSQDPKEMTKMQKQETKQQIKQERSNYHRIKTARWKILKNSDNLTDDEEAVLNDIFAEHQDLAFCYAMKEEMCDLYDIRDPKEAEERWTHWFAAAKASKIPPLVKFAENKIKRIDGLISHAIYPIGTGALEGLNNKIKVAKRIAYGYRDEEYFFTLIRYISLSQNRTLSRTRKTA